MARVKPRPQARGNCSLLVVVDSRSQIDYMFVLPTIIEALDHFGMPYSVFDLAQLDLHTANLQEYSAIVLAQEHLGSAMNHNSVRDIVSAVETGTGLIIFDHDIDRYGIEMGKWLGIQTLNPTFEGVGMDTAWSVSVSENNQYITYTQELGARREFRKPLEVSRLKPTDPAVKVLLKAEDGRPVLLATQLGRGRAVLFTVEPRIWASQFLGHVAGLDDVFWKSIIWAARKPFIMAAMPPFVAPRLDDAKGEWSGPPFGYVDIMNEFGFVPNVALFMDDITPVGVERIRKLQSEGRAEFSPHSLTYDNLIYLRRGIGDYSVDEAEVRERHIDELLEQWGVKRSAILNNHWLEVGNTALPYLKRIGQEYIMTSFLPGEPFEGIHKDWYPAPYGNITYVMDYLGGNPDLFAVMALDLPLYARTELPNGNYSLSIATLTEWDFLRGNTTFNGESPSNNIERAAQALAKHLKKGLDSLFFGSTITHEYMIARLSPGEWRSLLARALELMPRHEKIFVGYDHVARYARSLYDTSIVAVEASSQTVVCKLNGRASVDLQLYLFTDVDDGVEHRFMKVPAFEGECSLNFPL